MSNIWGRNLRLSIFGESHGPGVGIIIDGLPPGHLIDMSHIEWHMERRAPGRNAFSTPRKETDQVEILSGLLNGRTTGAPVCGLIRNRNTRSSDYPEGMMRPGTADLTAHIKYKGYNDYRGGGHFSGRLTAPLTFAGSIVRQMLESRGISIGAHILQIGTCRDEPFERVDADLLRALTKLDFPLLDDQNADRMKREIRKAAEEKDSVGGIVECAAVGHPAGLGSPFFESMESSLSTMIFSIPGTKGIEFGDGFAFASMKGSCANDELLYDGDTIMTRTNRSGGINGGITSGMPMVFRTAFRPTASIGKPQNTVDLLTGENKTIVVEGRHDPCIVQRAVVVVESALALCLMDSILETGWKE